MICLKNQYFILKKNLVLHKNVLLLIEVSGQMIKRKDGFLARLKKMRCAIWAILSRMRCIDECRMLTRGYSL